MAIQLRRGPSSRLMRHVMRHKAVATLFADASYRRVPSASQAALGLTAPPAVVPATTLVATPVLPDAGPDVTAALSTAAPRAEIASRLQPTAPPAAAPRDVHPSPSGAPFRPAQDAAPRPTPEAGQAAPPRTAPEAPPATPEPEADEDSAITDTVWRRLQTIFRRHQEGSAEEPHRAPSFTPAAEPPGPPPTTVNRAARETPQQQGPAGATGKPVQLQRMPRVEPPAEDEADHDTALLRIVQTDVEQVSPPAPASRAKAPPPPAPGLHISGAAQVTAPPDVVSGADERALADERAPADERGSMDAQPPVAEQGAPEASTLDAGSQLEDGSPRLPVSPLTEEPRWRVERRRDSAPPIALGATRAGPQAETIVPSTADAPRSATAPPTAVPYAGADEVPRSDAGIAPAPDRAADTDPTPQDATRIVAHVAAGRPTRSTIETIAPRSPRPALSGQRLATTVRRSYHPPAADPGEPLPADAPSREVEPAPRQITTPIGPLPADLWTLIGEPVPADHEDAGARSAQAEVPRAPSRTAPHRAPPAPGEAHPARIQRRLSAAGAPITARPGAPAPDRGAAMQPSTSTRGSADTTSGSPVTRQASPASPEEGANDAADGSPGVDVAELARRVYDEIKRRLALEGERFRGR